MNIDRDMHSSCVRMSKKFILPDCTLWIFNHILQVLVVRNDLKMGKGKIAAQCR